MNPETVRLSRDVVAIQIPYGDKTPLASGSEVTLTQELGGSFTVLTDQGMMVRIEARDADALGKKAAAPAAPAEEAPADLDGVVKRVWEQFKTCYDPEIPVNIVELGLVYECKVAPLPEGGFGVEAKMTLTAPGCGMGPVLQEEAQRKISSISGVKRVALELVLDPPWDPSMMSEAARLTLGM